MKQIRTCISVLCFTTLILLVLSQNVTYSQGFIPTSRMISPGSITTEVMVTKDMLDKGYYYRVYYVTNGYFPIWTVFYKTGIQNHIIAYSSKQAEQLGFNKFFIMNPWKTLGSPGSYKIAIMSPEDPVHFQEMIQTVRISSNTEQNLKDDKTLIVNDSIGVAPQKGNTDFKIRYQLNEDSNMTHKILQKEDNKEIWEKEKSNVPKGTRGFEWNREKGTSGHWYRAKVIATSVTEEGKWDHDRSREFKILE